MVTVTGLPWSDENGQGVVSVGRQVDQQDYGDRQMILAPTLTTGGVTMVLVSFMAAMALS